MRFHEIITESIPGLKLIADTGTRGYWLFDDSGAKLGTEYNEDDVAKHLIGIMRSKAQPWLQAIHDPRVQVLYRGIKGFDATAAEIPVRMRGPRDTTMFYHNIFNTILTAADSVANRSNSAFVSHALDQASGYGYVYVVVPLGDFHYTWSKWYDWTFEFDIEDILDLLHSRVRAQVAKLMGEEDGDVVFDVLSPGVPEILNDPESYDKTKVKAKIFADRDLIKGINTGNEILLHCKSALYINKDFYNRVMIPNL